VVLALWPVCWVRLGRIETTKQLSCRRASSTTHSTNDTFTVFSCNQSSPRTFLYSSTVSFCHRNQFSIEPSPRSSYLREGKHGLYCAARILDRSRQPTFLRHLGQSTFRFFCHNGCIFDSRPDKRVPVSAHPGTAKAGLLEGRDAEAISSH